MQLSLGSTVFESTSIGSIFTDVTLPTSSSLIFGRLELTRSSRGPIILVGANVFLSFQFFFTVKLFFSLSFFSSGYNLVLVSVWSPNFLDAIFKVFVVGFKFVFAKTNSLF